ncbi:hypothetical protein BJP37_23845 [Moorena bouillonii PNG]|uniref:Uncharacterized protein n=1 Tax=Moorena bouillonii PNG TaxID=568701 RepID=A0A1U7N6L8_9CYAN|nr:hypothetical protein BJP37_23845 [Moorena bouillonii PNG]
MKLVLIKKATASRQPDDFLVLSEIRIWFPYLFGNADQVRLVSWFMLKSLFVIRNFSFFL